MSSTNGAENLTLLTPAEVATIFRVSAKTVTRWAKEGKVRSLRTPGNQHRIFAEDVKALIEDQTA